MSNSSQTAAAAELYAALNTFNLGMEFIERAMIAFASTQLSEADIAALRAQVNDRQMRLKVLFEGSA